MVETHMASLASRWQVDIFGVLTEFRGELQNRPFVFVTGHDHIFQLLFRLRRRCRIFEWNSADSFCAVCWSSMYVIPVIPFPRVRLKVGEKRRLRFLPNKMYKFSHLVHYSWDERQKQWFGGVEPARSAAHRATASTPGDDGATAKHSGNCEQHGGSAENSGRGGGVINPGDATFGQCHHEPMGRRSRGAYKPRTQSQDATVLSRKKKR